MATKNMLTNVDDKKTEKNRLILDIVNHFFNTGFFNKCYLNLQSTPD